MHAHYTTAVTVGRAPMGCRSGHSVDDELMDGIQGMF